ncbi:MAG: hypothetical protein KGD68_15895 [Candidatus Lokiarchaeota archaeon]|nr:hypothetical protein [Candidatus Lokiarchaeota archaeon]
MAESEHEYRIFGAMYVILGFGLNFYFMFMMPGVQLLSASWFVTYGEGYLLVWFILFFGWLGSFVLIIFGFFLLVRDVLWVVRVSGALCLFLFICYFFVLYSSFWVVFFP